MVSKGLDVIRLDIGSPDTPPPPVVIKALSSSAHDPDRHSYSGYKGTPEFRKAVSRYYEKRFGVSTHPNQEVLPLIGSKEGIVNLALAYLDENDIVLVPDIGYPSYSMGAHLTGAQVYWMPIREENGFLPNFQEIPADVANRAKILWVNYPSNPTGTTVDLSFYQEAVDFCMAHNILLASDNPYVDVTFDGYRADSVLQALGAMNCAIEFMSFSKTYNMGGWRLGAAVGNAEALANLLQVKSNVDSGHFLPIYDAGVVAIDQTSQEWIDERNKLYERRRNRVMGVLPQVGLQAQCPKGSIYIWGRVQDGDGQQYVEEALNETYVSIAPGEAYGPGGKNYVRISLTVPDDRLETALSRLKTWYANR
jgi:LL-diaminopimelate aminotransferase